MKIDHDAVARWIVPDVTPPLAVLVLLVAIEQASRGGRAVR
jgi:hypothetical protein